ncbi:AraC family transcriptional regulator [Streptomyces mangrovisoli]|uniref:HTH araC/xylS-type domain-containing protein n=1 Tax=Streptomyces mangrovisoli TaxID=1428628 RepID=A0A1J4P0C1_9ACTN|nr:AraC family transcriptional regulator [Streptomyces mangrovisoli]OIJ68040.1 hypothetical protein WN71_009560 [Streptomyces mangrovisoli]
MKSGTTSAPVRFSTVGLPEARRVALWEEHNAEALIGLRCRSLQDTALDATEINLQLPRVHVARVLGSPHVVERTRAEIRRVPSDAVACYLSLAGDAFFYHDDGVRLLHPGQLLICDADQPFMRGFSHGLEELALKVPHTVWRDLGGPASLPQPLVIDDGSVQIRTLAALAARALRRESGEDPGARGDAAAGPGVDTGPYGAADGSADAGPDAGGRADLGPAADAGPGVDEDVLLDLLASVVTGRTGALTTVHLTVAKAYVQEHLADPGLSAARIARGIGISERHLSRVFAAGGTSVPQYLLGARLEHAHALLARSAERTVADVAARCGFGSAAHFSHRFKEHYGLRATDVLRAGRSRAVRRQHDVEPHA